MFKILELKFIELIVVVLAGVNQHVFACRSSFSMIRDSRMISGRVPTIVMTLSMVYGLAHDFELLQQ